MEKKAALGIMLTLLGLSMSSLVCEISYSELSEPPAIEWIKTYGGTNSDYAYSMIQTSDEGYALAGLTWSFGAGDYDIWFVKTDPNGNMQWNKTYGGAMGDLANSVVQTIDGGYILAGRTDSLGTFCGDFWLIKTDSNGNMQWNRAYGGISTDEAFSVIQTSDGGYALAGNTWSYGNGQSDSWLVKTDSNGNMQWNKTYGGEGYEGARSLIQMNDGGYIIGGYTGSYEPPYSSFWLIRTDSFGNMQWNKTYGGAGYEMALSMVKTSDEGFGLAGWTSSYGAGDYDFWLVKTDSNGNMQWSQTYGGTSSDVANSVIQTSDGGYALLGYTYSYSVGLEDFWLVKTNSAGTMQWNASYGGARDDSGCSVVETNDGGYAVAGYLVPDTGWRDFCLIKFATPPKPPNSNEALYELLKTIKTWSLPKGTGNSLSSKLEDTLHLLDIGNENGAVHKLMDFMSQVEALRGKKLSSGQADYLVTEAQRIIDLISK
jgi:hypothetical protein